MFIKIIFWLFRKTFLFLLFFLFFLFFFFFFTFRLPLSSTFFLLFYISHSPFLFSFFPVFLIFFQNFTSVFFYFSLSLFNLLRQFPETQFKTLYSNEFSRVQCFKASRHLIGRSCACSFLYCIRLYYDWCFVQSTWLEWFCGFCVLGFLTVQFRSVYFHLSNSRRPVSH